MIHFKLKKSEINLEVLLIFSILITPYLTSFSLIYNIQNNISLNSENLDVTESITNKNENPISSQPINLDPLSFDDVSTNSWKQAKKKADQNDNGISDLLEEKIEDLSNSKITEKELEQLNIIFKKKNELQVNVQKSLESLIDGLAVY